jgi:hypothetical protein
MKGKPAQIDVGKMYVALTSGVVSTAEEPWGTRITQGMRLLGSHPAVRSAPVLFCEADLPDDEIHRRARALLPQSAPSEPRPQPRVVPFDQLDQVPAGETGLHYAPRR